VHAKGGCICDGRSPRIHAVERPDFGIWDNFGIWAILAADLSEACHLVFQMQIDWVHIARSASARTILERQQNDGPKVSV
jgi:hypothetical protein